MSTLADDIFGYFERADQREPSFDPGRSVLCPYCLMTLGDAPLRMISLMLPGDNRSFFYRFHRACGERASDTEKVEIESALIDSRASGKSTAGGSP